MKIFHATAEATNLESQWAIPDIRWNLWCAAFGVNSLDGVFDMAPAAVVAEQLTATIARFDTHTEELRAHLHPDDVEGLRGNKRRLQGMRTFLLRNGGTISGAFDDSELHPLEGDTVVVLDSP